MQTLVYLITCRSVWTVYLFTTLSGLCESFLRSFHVALLIQVETLSLMVAIDFFLIIAHQQQQHFYWEWNFSESKCCFSPADATKEQNIHPESLLLLLRQSGPELRCVCCALIVTDGTLKTAIFDTRDKNIDNAIKIKPYCCICAVNSNTGDPWIHTIWSVRWTFFFLLIISLQILFFFVSRAVRTWLD